MENKEREKDKRRIIEAIDRSRREITRIRNRRLLMKYIEIEEEERGEKRVEYDKEERRLRKSESIEIGEMLVREIRESMREGGEKEEEGEREEKVEILKEVYYYLSRYLFSYYMVAIEFGIEIEKQFLGPRTSVLVPIARKLEEFYYKDRGVMTISMPQGTGKEQPYSSRVLTERGWKRMGEIEVGDRVIGALGRGVRVRRSV